MSPRYDDLRMTTNPQALNEFFGYNEDDLYEDVVNNLDNYDVDYGVILSLITTENMDLHYRTR